MTRRQQAIIWGLVILGFGLIIYVISPVLFPFIMGMAIAYLLDPVADFLESRGVPRLLATILILLIFVLLFILLLGTLVPILINQLVEFLQNMPGYLQTLEAISRDVFEEIILLIPGVDPVTMSSPAESFIGDTREIFTQLGRTVIDGTTWLMGLFSMLVIAPVVAFYLLRDWDKMTASIDSSLPRDHAATIRRLLSEMDQMISGFIRGQSLVALMLGTFYAISLTLMDLNFGLLIGIVSGLLSFIPYVGAFTGFILATGMAIIQFQDQWHMVALAAGIFLFGQTVESYYITPKIIGERVRLHPVWLIFAIVVGAYLMGFVGALIAMPMAAVIGVMVRFSMEKYYESDLYKGTPQLEQPKRVAKKAEKPS